MATKIKLIPLDVDRSDFGPTFCFIDFNPQEATDAELKRFIFELEQLDRIDATAERNYKLAINEQESRNAKV